LWLGRIGVRGIWLGWVGVDKVGQRWLVNVLVGRRAAGSGGLREVLLRSVGQAIIPGVWVSGWIILLRLRHVHRVDHRLVGGRMTLWQVASRNVGKRDLVGH